MNEITIRGSDVDVTMKHLHEGSADVGDSMSRGTSKKACGTRCKIPQTFIEKVRILRQDGCCLVGNCLIAAIWTVIYMFKLH